MMPDRQFREAFCVELFDFGAEVFVTDRAIEAGWMARYLASRTRTEVEWLSVRVEWSGLLTVRVGMYGGRYQDVLHKGAVRVWWGDAPWQSVKQTSEAPSVTDDHLTRVVAMALLAQIGIGDTSLQSVANTASAELGENIPLTGRKVGRIVREMLGLKTRRAGGQGRYCVIVTDADRQRIERQYGQEADDATE